MAGRRSGLLPVLKTPQFLIFSISQAISLFGDKLDYMALLAMLAFFSSRFAWDSPRAISFLSIVAALPTILFAPIAGVFVDRWDRRKIMIGCDSARTILVLAIPFVALATLNPPFVYILAFLVFLLGMFFNTARMSIIPKLVGGEGNPDKLLGANSFMNFTGRLATFAGMLVGGIIVDWHGWARFGINHPWTTGFYLDSVTYFVSVIALIAIYHRIGGRIAPGKELAGPSIITTLGKSEKRAFSSLKEAWKMATKIPSVRFVFGSVVLLVFTGASAFVLYIPIIQGKTGAGLGLGTKGVGFIAAIGSVGLVISSMVYGLIGHRIKKTKVILLSFLFLGITAAALSFTKSFAVVAPLTFLAGLALSPIYIAMDTLIHESVPDSVRGRIFSSREWVMHISFAISALVIGQLTRFFSARKLLLAAGLLVIITSSIIFFTSLRKPETNWR
ncbi:hypothetical protein CH330_07815 [candidate division WOR-3 bacterium JGI_Cruoil_03_51_56]|uniref:Major facilitator superfamily (MFS) profile domain-containing protein n=1 Tax=candidate division WOR-3 bacterium JGI_Cruoil_03_51_56 TaxID=1973747 RepID=A0A235BR44_UNCW3|nr:MAG: hypothetical protein CH330_07815 [candidate division WOR-3 bacterium JGI_Cruoil_03_51_56]